MSKSESSSPARSTPVLVAAGKGTTFGALVGDARGLGYTPFAIIRSIQEHTRPLFGPFSIGYLDDGNYYHVWQVGAALLAAIVASDGYLDIHEPIESIESSTLRAFLRAAGGLEGKDRIKARTDQEMHNAITSSVIRTIGFNKVMQCDFRYQLAMTLHLIGVRDAFPTALAGVDFESLFQNEFHCSANDYIEILYTIWLVSMGTSILNLQECFKATTDPNRFEALARRVLDPISCPIKEVKTCLQEKFVEFEADDLVQAFFTMKPFISIDHGVYLAPPAPFLRLVASTGAFFRTIELAIKQAAKQGATKPWTNEYSSAMGVRFEPLMHLLLEKCKTDGDVLIDEYYYLKDTKGPDFIVTNSYHPEEILIVQAKLKRLSPGAFFGYSITDFEANARGVLAELIWKSIRYVFRIETANPDKLNPEFIDLHRNIRSAKKILFLGVVPAMPPLFHIDKFRILVIESVIKKLNPDEREWLNSNKDRLDLWHILDFEEICEFLTVRKPERRIIEALSEYLRAPKFGKLVIEKDGILEPFGGWCMAGHKGPGNRVKELDDAYSEFSEGIINKFFKHEP